MEKGNVVRRCRPTTSLSTFFFTKNRVGDGVTNISSISTLSISSDTRVFQNCALQSSQILSWPRCDSAISCRFLSEQISKKKVYRKKMLQNIAIFRCNKAAQWLKALNTAVQKLKENQTTHRFCAPQKQKQKKKSASEQLNFCQT